METGITQVRKYRITIVGITPLLMHSDNIDWADQMEAWKTDGANKKEKKAGDDRAPAYRWVGCCYHDSKNLCMFSDNLSRCFMDGGAMVPVPGGKSGKCSSRALPSSPCACNCVRGASMATRSMTPASSRRTTSSAPSGGMTSASASRKALPRNWLPVESRSLPISRSR